MIMDKTVTVAANNVKHYFFCVFSLIITFYILLMHIPMDLLPVLLTTANLAES